jgi:hypothetical protein
MGGKQTGKRISMFFMAVIVTFLVYWGLAWLIGALTIFLSRLAFPAMLFDHYTANCHPWKNAKK